MPKFLNSLESYLLNFISVDRVGDQYVVECFSDNSFAMGVKIFEKVGVMFGKNSNQLE